MDEIDIVQLLQAGRAESSPERSRRYYDLALKTAERWVMDGGGTVACILGSQAAKELALDSDQLPARRSYWKLAVQALFWTKEVDPAKQAIEYVALVVDIFRDRYAKHDANERQRLFRHASKVLDEVLRRMPSTDELAPFLARKSALLRAGASLESPGRLRNRRLKEAHRAAFRAVELKETAPILLESALAEWALARYEVEATDEQYAERLRKAEGTLLGPLLDDFEPAQFARTEFYRSTYRAADACEQFLLCEAVTTNRRRLWRSAPLFAEAALQLHYAQYPEPALTEYLKRAMTFLEVGIAAGYRSGRVIVDLAFLHAVLDGTAAGLTALSDLVLDRGSLSWQQILDIVTQAGESDLPAYGLALGIDSSAVLTRLGTFANRFLSNPILSEALYRAAVRIDPHDPVALTNLARFLIRRGDPPDLREARRILQNVHNFADRRFRWWRPLLAELDSLEGKSPASVDRDATAAVAKAPASVERFSDLSRIRQHYRKVSKLEDHQQRGYELEALIYALARLTFGTAAPSYRFKRPLVNKIQQVDAFIQCRGEKYRCEFKWEAVPIGYNDIVQLADKLDVVGVSGLFVSMSGFDERAIAKAREKRKEKAILLVDGDEVDRIMRGYMNFDELMVIKRAAFDQRSEPYYHVVSSHEGP